MTHPRKGQAVTLGEAAEAYLATLTTGSRRGTRVRYNQALRPLVAHFGASAMVADLDMGEVAAWLERQWPDLAPSTRSLRRNALRSATQWWAMQRWIPAGLPSPAREPRASRKGTEAANKGKQLPSEMLTPAELQALMDACPTGTRLGVRTRAMIALLSRSGLRISELLSLRVSDVDLAQHSIRLLDTKSGEAQTAGFHPSADADLLRWMDVRKALGIRANGHPLFCTMKGEPVAANSVRRTLRRLGDEAGIEKRVHPHGLRDTFAVMLVQQGVDVVTIQRLLRHKHLSTTEVYLRGLTNHMALEALGKVDLPEFAGSGGGQEGRTPASSEALLAAQVAALAQQVAELQSAQEAQAIAARSFAVSAELARRDADRAKKDAREARRDADRAKLDAAQELMAEWADAQPEDGVAGPIAVALPIESLGLSARPCTCLKREGVDTVGQLLLLSEDDLMAIRNMGAGSVTEILEKLAAAGLELLGGSSGAGDEAAADQ